MSDHPSNNSTLKGLQGVATIRLTKPMSRTITVGIAIASSKILAATLKTAQQNDRESDSSKITHMHIDAIHTYERSSKQQ